jgi:hypothetical protein
MAKSSRARYLRIRTPGPLLASSGAGCASGGIWDLSGGEFLSPCGGVSWFLAISGESIVDDIAEVKEEGVCKGDVAGACSLSSSCGGVEESGVGVVAPEKSVSIASGRVAARADASRMEEGWAYSEGTLGTGLVVERTRHASSSCSAS